MAAHGAGNSPDAEASLPSRRRFTSGSSPEPGSRRFSWAPPETSRPLPRPRLSGEFSIEKGDRPGCGVLHLRACIQEVRVDDAVYLGGGMGLSRGEHLAKLTLVETEPGRSTIRPELIAPSQLDRGG